MFPLEMNLLASFMNLAGPELLRLGFHIFVVAVGVLILAGAVNTSLIGANGVMNRVAEDGVLFDEARKPHKPWFDSKARPPIPHKKMASPPGIEPGSSP